MIDYSVVKSHKSVNKRCHQQKDVNTIDTKACIYGINNKRGIGPIKAHFAKNYDNALSKVNILAYH